MDEEGNEVTDDDGNVVMKDLRTYSELGSIYDTPQWNVIEVGEDKGYNVVFNNTKYMNTTDKAEWKDDQVVYKDGEYDCATDGPKLFELIALCDPNKDVPEFTLAEDSSDCHIKYTSKSNAGCNDDLLKAI